MTSIVHEANQEYPFQQLSLANPHGVQGGAYFSKLLLNEETPCLFQTPKCLTKNGIIRTGKKTYCDLIIPATNDTFVNFLQEFEKTIQHLIYEKRNIWFHNEMEMENIEYFFNPILRTYKKQYLIRVYVQQPKHIKNLKSLQIYDENENRLVLNDVTKETKIISIVEGLGIKFTSSSFHLELCLRQVMVLEDKPIFEKCLIQTGRSSLISSRPIIPTMPTKTPGTLLTLKKKEELPSAVEDNSIDQMEQSDNLEEKPQEETQETQETEEASAEEEEGEPNKEGSVDMKVCDTKENVLIRTDDKQEINKTEPQTDSKKLNDHDINIETKINEKESMQSEDAESLLASASKMIIEKEGSLEKINALQEISLDLPPANDPIHLKKPIEVYREIYSKALEKAKAARRLAVQAFLEAQKIKNTFLLNEIEDSDDDLDNFEEILE